MLVSRLVTGWWLALATPFCWWLSRASTANAPKTCSPPSSATSGRIPAGASVANRLAAIVVSRKPGTTPPFGAVAPLADGYVVLLHGPVSAEIASPLGVVRLSGEQAVTWVDYKVEVAVDRLSVTSHDHPVQVDPMSDLRAGVVPGSGFVVTPGRSPEAPQREPASATPSATGSQDSVPAQGAGPKRVGLSGNSARRARPRPTPGQSAI